MTQALLAQGLKGLSGVVAVDGPAGAGKSTAAQGLARRLGAVRLDTGAIYRSLALQARRRGVSWDDGPGLAALAAALELRFDSGRDPQGVLLSGDDVTEAIRTPEMSQGASAVSRHPEVREALLGLQRRLGANGLVVAEGRDVGTTVFPAALAKIFLTASAEERARRRWRELVARGEAVDLPSVLAEQEARDRQDAGRQASPLRQADDAVVVDSSALDLEAVIDAMAAVVARAALRHLEAELGETESRLRDRELALPAHTRRPHQIIEVEELEEAVEALRTRRDALQGAIDGLGI